MPRRHHRFFSLFVVLLAVAPLMLLVSCHPPAASGNGLLPVRLQLDWYPQPEHGGFYAALENGYYREEGLDVTILPLGAYGSGLQMVAAGRADFGLGSSDQILEAVSNGLPLLAIGATMQHDPQALMVHTDSPVHSFADLDGHTVAVEPGAVWFRFLVQKYHLRNVREIPATLSIASFLADPAYIQQIFVTSEPYFVTHAGAGCRTLLISDAGYDPYRVFFTSRNFLARHPQAVAGFVRASIRGWRTYLDNPAPTNALLQRLNPALNPDQMNFTVQALRQGGFITGSATDGSQIGFMRAARWQQLADQLRQLAVIPRSVDPATAYTLQFVSQPH